MARPLPPPSPRAGKATPIVLLLLAAIAAMGFYATVPDYFRARDGIRVELAARAAARFDEVAREYVARGRAKSAADVTRAMVEGHIEQQGLPPVDWPDAADLSTIDFSDTNGVSVVVSLRSGPRRVSAADRRPAGDGR